MITRDLSQAVKLGVLALMTWATPPRAWHRLAEASARPLGRREEDPDRPLYVRTLGLHPDSPELAELYRRRRICRREAQMQILGLNGPWRSWRPEIHLDGAVNLRAALEAGHGAILWIAQFAYSDLILKMALDQAGYKASQLSRPQHGFADDPFAIRFLNPFWVRVEDRFLGERILIRGDDTKPAVDTLRRRLSANGIVTITVGDEARSIVEVPFLRDRLRMPIGPIRLAQTTGAALLPAFALARDDGGFDVAIEAPLAVPSATAGRERLPHVAAAYARRLEPYVEAHPEQWRGWANLIPREARPVSRCAAE
jgi:lauroyl/myristoyl acyltransferase